MWAPICDPLARGDHTNESGMVVTVRRSQSLARVGVAVGVSTEGTSRTK